MPKTEHYYAFQLFFLNIIYIVNDIIGDKKWMTLKSNNNLYIQKYVKNIRDSNTAKMPNLH